MDDSTFVNAIARVDDVPSQDASVLGTAFLVSADGGMVTCRHVVKQAGGVVWVRFCGRDPPLAARVELLGSPEEDLARLRLESAPPDLPTPLPLNRTVRFGHPFRSHGFRKSTMFPGGLPAGGEIRHLTWRRAADGSSLRVLPLQTSEIDDGMSGAPVLDVTQGAVVGVISARWETARTVDSLTAFAIPTEVLVGLWPDLVRLNPGLVREGLGLWGERQKHHLQRLAHLFVGRHKALDAVNAFLSDPTAPGHMFISAPAGFGKSALMARLVLTHPGCVYQILFEDDRWTDLLANLCNQLSALRGERASYAGRSRIENEDAFNELLAKLAAGRPPGEPLAIFLDGLDEPVASEADRVVRPDLFRTPPPGARFVLSHRSGLESLLPAADARTLALSEFEPDELRELLVALERPDLAADEDLVRSLMNRTGGDPFELRVLAEQIAEQPSPVIDLGERPVRAASILQHEVRRMLTISPERGTGLALAVLVQAKGWMRRDSLTAILTGELGADVVRKILAALQPRYLLTQSQQDLWEPGSESFRLWPLRLKEVVQGMLTAMELDHATALLTGFCRGWPAHRDPYALAHAVDHLTQAGDLAGLLGLLRREYFQARAGASGGFHVALTDAEAALRLAVDRRDVPAIVHAAGAHAWLHSVVRARAAFGEIAVDAKAGRFDSALSAARSLKEPPLRAQHLLIVGEAMLDRGDPRAGDVIDEALRTPATDHAVDEEGLARMARRVLVELGRPDLARALWQHIPSYATTRTLDHVLRDAALELFPRDPSKGLEVVRSIADAALRMEVLEDLEAGATGEARPMIEEALGKARVDRWGEDAAKVVILEKLVEADPLRARRELDRLIEHCLTKLEHDEDDETAAHLNLAILHLAKIDADAAANLAVRHARPLPRFYANKAVVLASIGEALARKRGPISTMRALLEACLADAEALPRDVEAPADRLRASLARSVPDPDEAQAYLASIKDATFAAQTVLQHFAPDAERVGRLAELLARAPKVTDEMAAAFRALSDDEAARWLAALPAGPTRWWLKLARTQAEPPAITGLRLDADETLREDARLAALSDLARRFNDVEALRRAAGLLSRRPVLDGWDPEYADIRRQGKRLELARLASALDPELARALFREAARDIPGDARDEFKAGQALQQLEILGNAQFRADDDTLTELFRLVRNTYERSRAILRVPGAEVAIEAAERVVKGRKTRVAIALEGRAEQVRDELVLERLEGLFDQPDVRLHIRLARARATPAGSRARQDHLRHALRILPAVRDCPAEAAASLGELLGSDLPDALPQASAALDPWLQVFLWAAAAAAHPSTLWGKSLARLPIARSVLTPFRWLAEAEKAAVTIGTVEQPGETRASREDGKGRNRDEDEEESLRQKREAAVNQAWAFSTIAVLAGSLAVSRRRAWIDRALRSLQAIDDLNRRVPLVLECALRFIEVEPRLCERSGHQAIEQLRTHREWTIPLFENLTDVLERDRTIASLAMVRLAWEAILEGGLKEDAAFGIASGLTLPGPQLARAAYEVLRLGGDVPERTLRLIRDECRGLDATEEPEGLAFLACGQAFRSRQAGVAQVEELITDQRALATILRYFPELPEDLALWPRLLKRVRSGEALLAAVQRSVGKPALADLIPLLSDLHPSDLRSKAFERAVEAVDGVPELASLAEVAVADPDDVSLYAAAWVRLAGGDLRAILNALDEVDRIAFGDRAA